MHLDDILGADFIDSDLIIKTFAMESVGTGSCCSRTVVQRRVLRRMTVRNDKD